MCQLHCRQGLAFWPADIVLSFGCTGEAMVSSVHAACPTAMVEFSARRGVVASYSLTDSKLGYLLGLDTNTPSQTPPAQPGNDTTTG